MRMQTLGRDLGGLLKDGIQLQYSKVGDQSVYSGFSSRGTTGLINNPNVTVASASNSVANPNGVTGQYALKKWANKSNGEIILELNAQLKALHAAAEYDLSVVQSMQILMPWDQWSDLNSRIVSTAGNKSLLTYLMENNYAVGAGGSLRIVGCRQTAGAGITISGTASDRAVFYVNDESKLSFDMPIPLTPIQTSFAGADYLTPYYYQIGQVKLKYLQTIRYLDGI